MYYLFWTGGFDSTFRLIQLLDQGHSVHAIYIATCIDNIPTGTAKRHSQSQELATMHRIRERIRQMGHEFELEVIWDEIEYVDWLRIAMESLYGFGLVRRPVCQYGAMAQISLMREIDIEVGVECEPSSSKMWNAIHAYMEDDRICWRALWGIRGMYIFRNLRFPLINLSKRQMMEIAAGKGWVDLLKMTWSCWYPKEDGKPCRQCNMCHERVLKDDDDF